MAEGTLYGAFLDELREPTTPSQLTKALAKLAEVANAPELREAFESHREETLGQIQVYGGDDSGARSFCDRRRGCRSGADAGATPSHGWTGLPISACTERPEMYWSPYDFA
jgi:hypothetical protein